MRSRLSRTLPALVCALALPLGARRANAQPHASPEPPSLPATTANARAPFKLAQLDDSPVPHPSEVRPVDAPAPSMEAFLHAFEPAPGGLTSDEIVKQALAYSPQLKKAELSEDTAKANKARASIAFAPRIDLLGKYTHLSKLNYASAFGAGGLVDPPGLSPSQEEARDQAKQVLAQTFQGVSFQQKRNQAYFQAGATLPVTDMFLTVIPTYKGAATLAEVAQKRTEASRLQVSYEARTAFYNYAHIIGAVIIAERAIELYESNVRDLESLVAAGTATQTDLIRARAALARSKVQAVDYKGMQEVALEQLATVTGTEINAARGIGERFVGISMSATPETSRVMAEAKRSRPELVALRKLEEAREHFARAKRGSQYPQLNGFSNFYVANPHPRVVPQQQKWYNSWDVGVSLSYSPNDSIYAHTQYKDALTELESVRQDLRLVEDGIDIEVAQAVTHHRTAVAATEAATASLDASRRYQLDQRALMLAGAATPNDVLEAQVLLTRAALEWVDAFISVRIAEAALLKAQGKTTVPSSESAVARSTP